MLSECKQRLEQMHVALEYLEDQEILDIDEVDNQQSAFIINTFDGQIFDHLQEKNARIWSHHLLSQCLSQSKPLPKTPLVLHSLAFEGTAISLSGMNKEKKTELKKKAEMMGGTVLPNFYSTTDLLVAETLDTTAQKYLAAVKWKIPIVRPEFIDKVWSQCANPTSLKDPKFLKEYRVPVFKGCIICTSGLNPQERTIVGQLVENHGGKYVAEMAKDVCTHLVVVSPAGEKYKFASLWGIKVVTPTWLRRCVETGMRFHERKFHPDPEIASRTRKSVQKPTKPTVKA
ncbi:unnamed protein product [Bursaphelenchus xylophilus]|nr:unnamed protein product [Bursaphelenchus xylophilus]CAG9122037.1 unnamed protein product [Bursaphelenchus xylophilus]